MWSWIIRIITNFKVIPNLVSCCLQSEQFNLPYFGSKLGVLLLAKWTGQFAIFWVTSISCSGGFWPSVHVLLSVLGKVGGEKTCFLLGSKISSSSTQLQAKFQGLRLLKMLFSLLYHISYILYIYIYIYYMLCNTKFTISTCYTTWYKYYVI